jgi:hypothetical protein
VIEVSTKTKTVYDEAIADVKKLKELAEQRARDAVLAKVEPRLKELVEQQLFNEGEEEKDDIDEASSIASGAMQGSMNPSEEVTEVDETQYEVSEGTELAELADFTQPVSNDRFVASVYRFQEDVQQLVVAKREEKLTEAFSTKLEEAILKLEDMYAYLRESYAGDDKDDLEDKLEKGYGLVNAVKESTMKMRDLLNEEDLTVKINNLPDGVDPDAITIDVVADEEVPDSNPAAAPVADPAAAAAPPVPTAEGDEPDEDEDEVLEISESDLKAELSRLRALRENDAAPSATKGNGFDGSLDDFGDADNEGHPGPKGEADGGLEDIAESDNIKLESARARLSRAAKRLSEARDTAREDFARAMYQSAVKAYRTARKTLIESKSVAKKVSAPVVKNTTSSKELAESKSKVVKLTKELEEAQLLNAKLIHANKLLRLEGLTKAQQAMVIDRLDEARNLREVRLISENIKAVLTGSKGSVNESVTRRPSGSASRPSKSGSSLAEPLTEGLETARWATLAGLK